MDGIASGGAAPAEESDADADKRREGRKAFLKRAQVVFEGAGVDCIVENMSKGGARVRFATPVALPEVLALRFGADLRLKDIAALTHLPVSTVHERLQRGLRRLQVELERDPAPPPAPRAIRSRHAR